MFLFRDAHFATSLIFALALNSIFRACIMITEVEQRVFYFEIRN